MFLVHRVGGGSVSDWSWRGSIRVLPVTHDGLCEGEFETEDSVPHVLPLAPLGDMGAL